MHRFFTGVDRRCLVSHPNGQNHKKKNGRLLSIGVEDRKMTRKSIKVCVRTRPTSNFAQNELFVDTAANVSLFLFLSSGVELYSLLQPAKKIK